MPYQLFSDQHTLIRNSRKWVLGSALVNGSINESDDVHLYPCGSVVVGELPEVIVKTEATYRADEAEFIGTVGDVTGLMWDWDKHEFVSY